YRRSCAARYRRDRRPWGVPDHDRTHGPRSRFVRPYASRQGPAPPAPPLRRRGRGQRVGLHAAEAPRMTAGEGAMATERTEMAQELEIARNRLANGAGRILLLKRPKLFHVETENMGPSLSGKAPEHARRRVRPSAAPPAPPGRVRDSGGKRPIH